MTGQRRVIARSSMRPQDHPDVVELHRRAAAVDDRISLSTVYRTVKLFETEGIIERLEFRDGRSRYEQAAREHHDHLINLETGDVIEFQSEEIEALQTEIARRLGYKVVYHRLELYAVPSTRTTREAHRRRVAAAGPWSVQPRASCPLQMLALRFGWPILHRLPVSFHRMFLRLFGIRVVERGTPPSDAPTLVLSNHVSWLDIPVIGSLHPLSFVAKSEVASWPVVGCSGEAATLDVHRPPAPKGHRRGQRRARRTGW